MCFQCFEAVVKVPEIASSLQKSFCFRILLDVVMVVDLSW